MTKLFSFTMYITKQTFHKITKLQNKLITKVKCDSFGSLDETAKMSNLVKNGGL